MPIRLKIDVTKIDKARLFKGAKGTYLDAALIERPDDFGNAGFIVQEVTKEEREAGTNGAIIGNWKDPKAKAPSLTRQPVNRPSGPTPVGDDDIMPFAPNVL